MYADEAWTVLKTDMREHKHGRDLMNPASPTFSFSLLSTWVLRLRDLFRVRELISDRAWALIIFFLSFSPFPYDIWGLGHHCPVLARLPFLPTIQLSNDTCSVSIRVWMLCRHWEIQELLKKVQFLPFGSSHSWGKKTLNRQWQGRVWCVLCQPGT